MKKDVVVFSMFALLCLFSSLAYADECRDACQASYDYWYGIDEAKFEAKSYYCGVSQTNCWSRTTTPAGQPDPCWSICTECSPWTNECDNNFQSCCWESAQINAQDTLDKCIAQCPAEEVETDDSWSGNSGSVECEGSVNINKCGGEKSDDFVSGVVVTTGRDGGARLTWENAEGKELEMIVCPLTQVHVASSEHSSIRGTINGGGDFLDCPVERGEVKTAQKEEENELVISLSSEHGSIRGTCNGGGDFISPKEERNLQLEGRNFEVVYLSSEHGSIRGTCNGGGDFISSPEMKGLLLEASSEENWLYGHVAVSAPSNAPELTLAYSLPSGVIEIASEEGDAQYSVDPNGEGVKISVASGSVVARNVESEESETIEEGESRSMSVAAEEKDEKEAGSSSSKTGAACSFPVALIAVLGAVAFARAKRV
ncbi:MAG: hypothetical protein ABIH99_01060 [Candidatus Micrarchaeota archaeon]